LSIDLESKVSRNPQVVARELAEGEGGVLLHLETGQYHGVNAVGFLVWEVLDEQKTVRDVVDAVRGRVLDPPDKLEGDIVHFLESVKERDLLLFE
jgi:hypothetical protein